MKIKTKEAKQIIMEEIQRMNSSPSEKLRMDIFEVFHKYKIKNQKLMETVTEVLLEAIDNGKG